MSQTSIVGFKNKRIDLHKQSPKILSAWLLLSVIAISVTIRIPFITRNTGHRVIEDKPVILHIENIPETRQETQVSAPRISMPVEIDDDLMIDDVTIEDTSLDILTDVTPPPPPPPVVQEEIIQENLIEEETFEFFAVEEAPKKLREVAAEYPKEAIDKGIEGVVFVRALVGADGSVTKTEILKGPKALHQAALDAAKKTPFSPAKQNDLEVPCWVQLVFRFVIE